MISKYILLIINFTLALSMVFYTIYRRLFTTRFARELYFYYDYIINYGLICLVIISIVTCFVILKSTINIIIKKPILPNFLSSCLLRINLFIETALYDLYNYIMSKIPNVYDKISYFTEIFYKYFKDVSEAFFLLILYSIRTIILCCFLIDVFIFFKLEYMYKSFALLSVSLIIKIIFYVLKDFASNLDEARSMLIITETGINPETKEPITSYQFTAEYRDENLDLIYHIGQYILCNKITGYLHMHERYKAILSPYFNCIIYGFYLIRWCYILYCNKTFVIDVILSLF